MVFHLIARTTPSYPHFFPLAIELEGKPDFNGGQKLNIAPKWTDKLHLVEQNYY